MMSISTLAPWMSAAVPVSRMGRSKNTTVLTRLKMDVFTPIASANVRVETTAKPGLLRSARIPNLRS